MAPSHRFPEAGVRCSIVPRVTRMLQNLTPSQQEPSSPWSEKDKNWPRITQSIAQAPP